MSGYPRRPRQNDHLTDSLPANKKPRIGNIDNGHASDDEDPFADDITGEEWEFAASQAEISHSQCQVSNFKTVQNVQAPNSIGSNVKSFKRPTSRSVDLGVDPNQKLIDELKTKLSVYEKKVAELESSYNRKNGETLVLRDRLSNAEKHLTQEKLKMVEMQNMRDQQDSEREKVLQKEIEKYKDEVQFKQVEIQESQNLIRNLEGKIRSLEQKISPTKSKSPKTISFSNHGEGLPMIGWTKASNIALFGNNSKKIRLVKPESPRCSTGNLLRNVEFSDDPLEQKKAGKSSSTDLVSSVAVKTDAECSTNQTSAFELKSKVLHKDSLGQGILRNLLSRCKSVPSSELKKHLPPFLQMLKSETDDYQSIATTDAVESLKQYLVSNHEQVQLLAQSDDMSLQQHTSGLLNLIRDQLRLFMSLHESASGSASSVESSYHTAPSQELKKDSLPLIKVSKALRGVSLNRICLEVLSALQTLKVLSEYLPKLCFAEENADLIASIYKMSDINHWSPKIEFSDEILILILKILNIFVQNCINTGGKTFDFSKNQLWLALVTHKNIEVKCCSMNVLMSLLPFDLNVAMSVLKPDAESPSVLCHLTDLMCVKNSEDEDLWLNLQEKILSFLLSFVANYQSLLMQHSCFCEIYHGADSLLYNQLSLWKSESQRCVRRCFLIKSALCLLHSCANVYPDGIPGSRRQHSHQFTLTLLNEFLEKDGDHDSFWNAELSRIVKSEVKAIIEEVDSS